MLGLEVSRRLCKLLLVTLWWRWDVVFGYRRISCFQSGRSIRFSKPCFCHLQNIAEFFPSDWLAGGETRRDYVSGTQSACSEKIIICCTNLGVLAFHLGMLTSLLSWLFKALLWHFLPVTLPSQNEACSFLSCPCSGIMTPPVLMEELCTQCSLMNKKTCCRSRGPNIEASAWGQRAFGSLFRSKINFPLWVPVLS